MSGHFEGCELAIESSEEAAGRKEGRKGGEERGQPTLAKGGRREGGEGDREGKKEDEPLQRIARLSPRASAVAELKLSTKRCFIFFMLMSSDFPSRTSACNLL